MAAASRARAKDLYSWPTVIRRLEELWEELDVTAGSLEPLARPATPAYYQPFFFEAFRHYATRIIGDDATLVRTPSGAAALESDKELAPKYGDLDPTVMRQALEHVDDNGLTIAEVLHRLRGPEPSDYLDPPLRRQIMRLVKYGYAQLK